MEERPPARDPGVGRAARRRDAARAFPGDAAASSRAPPHRRRAERHARPLPPGLCRSGARACVLDPRRVPRRDCRLASGGRDSSFGCHLQSTLFALRDFRRREPHHTHHFNYGFALNDRPGARRIFSGHATLAAVRWRSPSARARPRVRRVRLIWNLNPDYYQSLSYEAQAVLATAARAGGVVPPFLFVALRRGRPPPVGPLVRHATAELLRAVPLLAGLACACARRARAPLSDARPLRQRASSRSSSRAKKRSDLLEGTWLGDGGRLERGAAGRSRAVEPGATASARCRSSPSELRSATVTAGRRSARSSSTGRDSST